MRPVHLAFILLIDLLWGFNVVALKFAVESIEPLTVTFLRYSIVLLVCLPWLRWLPGRMSLVLLTAVVAGALFMGLVSLSFAAADNISALSIVGQLGVPFSLVLAVLFLGERIRWVRILGIALSFFGVVIIGFDPALFDERLGILLTIFASMTYAVGSLLFRRLQGVPVLTIHAWLALISVPVLFAASWFFEPGGLQRAGAAPATTLGWIAYSAIGSSVIGHAGTSYLLQRYPVSVVAPMTLPTPLISVLFAVLVFDTPLTAQLVAGGMLTLAGVAIITFRSAQAREREVTA